MLIANNGRLTGTIRTQKEEIRTLVFKRLEEIVDGICKANNAKYSLDIQRGYNAMYNSEAQVKILENAASKIDGVVLEKLEPMMGSEDFSAYLSKKPGAFSFIGAGGEHYNHHPQFMVEDKALETGAAIHLQVIIDELGV